jgi:hypothetical protein
MFAHLLQCSTHHHFAAQRSLILWVLHCRAGFGFQGMFYSPQ